MSKSKFGSSSPMQGWTLHTMKLMDSTGNAHCMAKMDSYLKKNWPLSASNLLVSIRIIFWVYILPTKRVDWRWRVIGEWDFDWETWPFSQLSSLVCSKSQRLGNHGVLMVVAHLKLGAQVHWTKRIMDIAHGHNFLAQNLREKKLTSTIFYIFWNWKIVLDIDSQLRTSLPTSGDEPNFEKKRNKPRQERSVFLKAQWSHRVDQSTKNSLQRVFGSFFLLS